MPAPTPLEIKNALIGLRDSAEIAPLGNNIDVVAALLYLQLINQSSGGSNATSINVTFSNSTTSSVFGIVNRLALIVIPVIANAPTLTLQITLDNGTTWVNSSISVTASSTVPLLIEADALARVSGGFGLANAFRFSSTVSISSAILNVRSILR